MREPGLEFQCPFDVWRAVGSLLHFSKVHALPLYATAKSKRARLLLVDAVAVSRAVLALKALAYLQALGMGFCGTAAGSDLRLILALAVRTRRRHQEGCDPYYRPCSVRQHGVPSQDFILQPTHDNQEHADRDHNEYNPEGKLGDIRSARSRRLLFRPHVALQALRSSRRCQ